MNKINKEMIALAMAVVLLSGCATTRNDTNTNTVVQVGTNNRIMVSSTSDSTGIKRIIAVPSSSENKEALKYTLPGDEVKVFGKNYDKNRVMDEAKVIFNTDTIYARQQRELFEQAKAKYFKTTSK